MAALRWTVVLLILTGLSSLANANERSTQDGLQSEEDRAIELALEAIKIRQRSYSRAALRDRYGEPRDPGWAETERDLLQKLPATTDPNQQVANKFSMRALLTMQLLHTCSRSLSPGVADEIFEMNVKALTPLSGGDSSVARQHLTDLKGQAATNMSDTEFSEEQCYHLLYSHADYVSKN